LSRSQYLVERGAAIRIGFVRVLAAWRDDQDWQTG
jgi:hypothetical protein